MTIRIAIKVNMHVVHGCMFTPKDTFISLLEAVSVYSRKASTSYSLESRCVTCPDNEQPTLTWPKNIRVGEKGKREPVRTRSWMLFFSPKCFAHSLTALTRLCSASDITYLHAIARRPSVFTDIVDLNRTRCAVFPSIIVYTTRNRTPDFGQ